MDGMVSTATSCRMKENARLEATHRVKYFYIGIYRDNTRRSGVFTPSSYFHLIDLKFDHLLK